MPTPPTLCVLGDFAWDVLIHTDTELHRGGDTLGRVELLPGGSAANVAVWARRCGVAVTFVGKVGRDSLARLAAEDLAAEDVTSILPTTGERPTGSVAVFVDHTGERSMVSGQGADFELRPGDLPVDVLRRCGHLHLTAWSFFSDPPRSAARDAAALARDGGATLSFDPGSFQMIGDVGAERFISFTADLGIDVLLPNREEGAALTGLTEPEKIAAELHVRYGGALVVLKLDADGALVDDGSGARFVPPTPTAAVDATGAGDSFAGAFLAAWRAGADPVAAATLATQVGAWVIGHTGSRPAADVELLAAIERGMPSQDAPRDHLW